MNTPDSRVSNAFRKRVWRFGVKLPHQGSKETARRQARALKAALA